MPTIPKHQTPDPRRKKFKMPHRFNHRTNEQDKRYWTHQWKKARAAFIRENPTCKRCHKLAQVIDHVVPVNQGGEFWDVTNWQPLCKQCHDIKSGREAHWQRG